MKVYAMQIVDFAEVTSVNPLKQLDNEQNIAR